VFDGLVTAVVELVRQYGYVAVFVYMVLETAFVLHYVPSEVVVPFAAAELVHDPASFVFFVADTTAGATIGSLLAYWLFGLYGRTALERYGHVVHVTPETLARGDAVFTRYGESSVLWGRLLPFVRAFISIPAGMAGMERRRFAVYSAAGALLFNTALTYLVYTASDTTSPLHVTVAVLQRTLRSETAYAAAHPVVVAVATLVLAALLAGLWLSRDWLRAHPAATAGIILHLVRVVGILVGVGFVLGALVAPARSFDAITAVWNDPIFWVGLGFSERVALLLQGVLVALCGLLAYEVGQLLELAHVRRVLDRLRP